MYQIGVSFPISYSFTTTQLPLAYAVFVSIFQSDNNGNFKGFNLYACCWNIQFVESNSIVIEMKSGNCNLGVNSNNSYTGYYGLDTGTSILDSSSSLPSSTLSIGWSMPPTMYSQFVNLSSTQRVGSAYFYM